MSYLIRITPAAPGNTAIHFPGDGEGSFTSITGAAALTATYTASGATLTGGASIPGSVGDTGYCFTSDGYYAPYRVVTAGANGVIEVDIWRHANMAQLGRVPAVGSTLNLHTPSSCMATYQRSIIESIAVRVSGAGDTLTITDPKGLAVDTIIIPANMAPGEIDWPMDGKVYKGTFGFNLTTGSVLGLDIIFRGAKPTTKASRLSVY